MKDSKFEKGLFNKVFVPIEEIYEVLDKAENKVYEVIRIIDGKPLFLEEHVDRLNNSIMLIDGEAKISNKEIIELINMLIGEYNLKNINVKITFYQNPEANLFAYFSNSYYPDPSKYLEGYKTLLIYEERDNPNAKVLNNELRDLINDILLNEDSDECIYVSEKGDILEGSRTNLFFVKGSAVITAPDSNVLIGTTRNKVISICQNERITVQRRSIRIEELSFFDAAFVTGTSIDIMPIKLIGSIKYNSPKNRIVEKIMKQYNKEKLLYLNK